MCENILKMNASLREHPGHAVLSLFSRLPHKFSLILFPVCIFVSPNLYLREIEAMGIRLWLVERTQHLVWMGEFLVIF